MPQESPLIAQLNEISFAVFVPGDFTVGLHLHHFHQLDVILSGQVFIGLDGRPELQAGRGTTVLIPPLCRHSYRSQRGFSQVSFKLHVSPQHWTRFGNEPCCITLPGQRLRELEHCGRRYDEGAPLAHQQAVSLGTLCLISLAESVARPPVASDDANPLAGSLWSMLEAIEERPYEPWTVADLAQSCHLSADHFSRSFQRLTSTTPHRYLLEARMRAAAATLVNRPACPIKQISEEAGYATVHAFSRAFKAVFNTSPAAYRQAPRRL